MARLGGGWAELGGDPGGLMLVTSNWQLVIGDVRPVILAVLVRKKIRICFQFLYRKAEVVYAQSLSRSGTRFFVFRCAKFRPCKKDSFFSFHNYIRIHQEPAV